jgi:hypothetical protein
MQLVMFAMTLELKTEAVLSSILNSSRCVAEPLCLLEPTFLTDFCI